MERIQQFTKEVEDLRNNMLATLRDFFQENPNLVLVVEDILGSNFVVEKDTEVRTISAIGVDGDAAIGFDELSINDLDFIIDTINSWICNEFGCEDELAED